ncbi:hypothetical protein CHS0354_005837 [Potamilus streckersoni]|uniref:Arf-GAP domain-containing protein n=1 Tax=Potamilus streckersoni TaxID=2493646 RepID=A0AAE0RQH3_9BIVA|nr:hypothetical protein CHS0354_005837 [Potamilus streckersoni]
MTSRTEKDKQKAQQEKFQAVLSSLLKDDDNKYCVDCDAKGPRWASWNLGVFLCIRCAGIHRNLGVHISKVKSVNLDTWTPEQVAMMMEMGNSRARAVYEANMPDNQRRPQTDSALEAFIRSKYEQKKFIAREWVPPKPVIPKDLNIELLEDEKDKKKSKGAKPSGQVQLNSAPVVTTPSHSKAENKPVTSSPPKVTETKSQTTKPQGSNMVDLIGLDSTIPVSQPSSTGNLLDLEFIGPSAQSTSMLPPRSQSTPQLQQNGNLEANLFDDTSSTSGKPPKSAKDSILALYGSNNQQPQHFGVPGGLYMPQQNVGMGIYSPAVVGMPQQMMGNPMAVQQPPMYGGGGMMGMQQPAMMGMQPGIMGIPQGNMGMYTANPQMQQIQFQQMQQQMAAMRLAGAPMGGMAQTAPGTQGWGTQSTAGHTLSTNLWQ